MENSSPLHRAIALHQQGQLAQAATLYLRILETDPAHFDALHLLGVYALQTGDAQAACDLIGQACAIRPDDALARANLGSALRKLGRLDAALDAYRQALLLAPDDAALLSNCGGTLSELKRPAEALPLLERALRIAPGSAEALNNLGYALSGLHRHEEALPCLERALRLQPGFVPALYNLGNALQLLNRTGAALASYARALALDPEHVDTRFSAGVCRLLDGDLERGWPDYQWRRRKPAYAGLDDAFRQPMWLGQAPLNGASIVLHAEQGYGDTLQLCRYAPLLAQQGAHVMLRVQPALVTLLGTLAGVSCVIGDDQPLPGADYHCPLMSLPLALRTTLATLPAGTPYLSADPALAPEWQARLGPAAAPRIGLAWAGNSGHDNDQLRSVTLPDMRRVLAPGFDFISLQQDLRAADRLLLERDGDIRSYAGHQTDFAQTAALVAQLDLVICVDTAIAHLAGALGKPVWLLLPFAPDWRWMLERSDSPWYPTMRLFRQPRHGDWRTVLDEVRAALAAR